VLPLQKTEKAQPDGRGITLPCHHVTDWVLVP